MKSVLTNEYCNMISAHCVLFPICGVGPEYSPILQGHCSYIGRSEILELL